MTLNKLTTAQLTKAFGKLKGIPVRPKTFNSRARALERVKALMSELDLSTDDVLRAAGVQAARTPVPPKASKVKKPRANTKQANLIDLLRRSEGATMSQIEKATGWEPHTIRGAISGALRKKLGLQVTASKTESGTRVYRIVDPA